MSTAQNILAMRRAERFEHIRAWFAEHRPDAAPELRYDSPFSLLVAVMLSAQCTDKRVNMVTPALLKAFPDARTMASASFEDLFPYVRSVSYPNSKTEHLLAMARMLESDFGGQVPCTVEELQRLPGVGRKTANVVTSVLYQLPVIAVDTHVFRVAHRLGLSDGRTPLAVETDLEKGIPPSERPLAHHWLILHGRYVCTARSPKCGECGLAPWCREYGRTHKDV